MRAFQQRGQEGAHTEGAHLGHTGACTVAVLHKGSSPSQALRADGSRDAGDRSKGKAVFARKQDKDLATGTCCVL